MSHASVCRNRFIRWPPWQVTLQRIVVIALAGSTLTACVERMVEPADVFGDVHRGETYSPASTMIDDWYAIEAIDAQTFAINEPKSSQYNTSYLLIGETRALNRHTGYAIKSGCSLRSVLR